MRHKAFVLITVVCAPPLAWADGMLDPDFGTGGLVMTNFGPGSSEEAVALAIQPDGKAIAAGPILPNLAQSFMGAVRYLPSGALDPSFDGDGMTTVGFDTGPIGGCSLGQVLLQPDGRIVLVGVATQAPPIPPVTHYALARLNADGSLDASFGTGGKVQTVLTAAVAAGTDALLQPGGRILVLGATGTFGAPVLALARFDTNGSPDLTFGGTGQVSIPLPVSFEGAALALQADGKILIAGVAGPSDFGLVRLLPGGAPDPTFDGDGFVSSDFGGSESVASVAVLGDGRILVAGDRSAPTHDLALVRYLSNGALDMTFGTGGLATADGGGQEVSADLLVQPDGKLLVLGTLLASPSNEFILGRFSADGALDTTFGTAGFLRTDFPGVTGEQAHAVALAGPDRVLAAGLVIPPPTGNDFALARYIASTPVEVIGFSVE